MEQEFVCWAESLGRVLEPRRMAEVGGSQSLHQMGPRDYLTKSPDYPEGETESQIGEVTLAGP